MKSRYLLSVLAVMVLVWPLTVQATESPAEKKIAAANAAIAKNPKFPEGYANLALALAMRARETSNTAFYEQGLKAIDQALAIDKTSFPALKAQAWLLLGKHEFAKALEVAKALNQRSGDDLMVYGLLSDANTELGNYDEAEKATQWMLDLRPGNGPALTRASHLRELFGDSEGAMELMQMTYQQFGASESENRAWTLVQMAHLRLSQGRISDAEQLATQALATFPGYHYALGQMAKIRRAQKRYGEAVAFERQRLETAPHAENRFVLAQTLELAGEKEEALKAFAEFERAARAEMMTADNANHELVFYYADHARKPQEALKVARLEMARRNDVHTLHAYAWALHVAGNDVEARRQMERALAVGTRDREMFQHAAAIALRLKDREAAKVYERKAAELAPVSVVARAAASQQVR